MIKDALRQCSHKVTHTAVWGEISLFSHYLIFSVSFESLGGYRNMSSPFEVVSV